MATAAFNAPGAVGKAIKNASPSRVDDHATVLTALRSDRAPMLHQRIAYASSPTRSSNRVEPSTSLKRNVTVPLGSSVTNQAYASPQALSSVTRATHAVSSAHRCARRGRSAPSPGHDGKNHPANTGGREMTRHPAESGTGWQPQSRSRPRSRRPRAPRRLRRRPNRPFPARPDAPRACTRSARQRGDRTNALTGVALNPISGLGPGAVDVG